MSNVVKLQPKHSADASFGVCPSCGSHDGYVNKGSQHWFICRAHRVRWLGGINYFDDWREESRAEQRERFGAVESFDVIRPTWKAKGAA